MIDFVPDRDDLADEYLFNGYDWYQKAHEWVGETASQVEQIACDKDPHGFDYTGGSYLEF